MKLCMHMWDCQQWCWNQFWTKAERWNDTLSQVTIGPKMRECEVCYKGLFCHDGGKPHAVKWQRKEKCYPWDIDYSPMANDIWGWTLPHQYIWIHAGFPQHPSAKLSEIHMKFRIGLVYSPCKKSLYHSAKWNLHILMPHRLTLSEFHSKGTRWSSFIWTCVPLLI